MSDALYRTRLWWDGRRGSAIVGGVRHVLTFAPFLDGVGAFASVEYAPEVQVAQIQFRTEPARDMYPHEIIACRRYLGLPT